MRYETANAAWSNDSKVLLRWLTRLAWTMLAVIASAVFIGALVEFRFFRVGCLIAFGLFCLSDLISDSVAEGIRIGRS